MYEKKCQLKTFLRIYKCIDIKYNTILLKNKAIYNFYICYQTLSYKHISRGHNKSLIRKL